MKNLRLPIFAPSCEECLTSKCLDHCLAIKCATCGRWLYDRFYADGLGELPRPHHLPKEQCSNEDPVRVSADEWNAEEKTMHDDPTHPRTVAFWFSRIFIIVILGTAFIGGSRIILKVSGDTVNGVLHDAAWEAALRAEIASVDSELAGIHEAQAANEKAHQKE